MDKTLAWLWLADAVGSGCQYARELLDLYPDPAELYDILRVLSLIHISEPTRRS